MERVTAINESGLAVPRDISAPSRLAPPLSNAWATQAGAAVWPTTNLAIFSMFHMPFAGALRYVNFRLEVASGNIQAGVVALSGPGLVTYSRVMNSGVIACPSAANPARIDLGATVLPSGMYAAFLFVDNVVFQCRHISDSRVATTKQAAEAVVSGGVPASGTLAWTSNRVVVSLTLEAS